MADETKYKVGDEELTLDELIKGYMRQRDYSKKTQALADDRRRLEEEMESLRQEAERARKWDEWYNATYKGGVEDTTLRERDNLEESDEIVTLKKEITQLKSTIEDLKKMGSKEIETLMANNERLQRALTYMFDLDDLKDRHLREYPDIPFDKARIIDEAFKYNKPDLTRSDWDIIYNQVYRDEFINRDVERKLAERLKSEQEKQKASKAAESGEFIKPFKLPEKLPTDSATLMQDAVSILREERAKRGE